MSDTDIERRFSLKTIGAIIRDIGLPGVICLVLLFQTNQKLDALIASVNRLVVIVEAKK